MSERLLSARELAELLGFTAGTIVDWAEAGKVPAFKVGGRLRFRESEVVAWLEAQRLPASLPASRVVSSLASVTASDQGGSQ